VYEPAFDSNEPQRLALLAELHGALERQELILEYQPKTELATGRVTGVEALVRWQHPSRGLLLPAEFLPAAERTGLITPITRYVLDLALRQLRVWHEEGLQLRVAVNLSARDLLDLNLPNEVERLLTQHRVPANFLELELTESTAMADPGRAGLVLQALRDLGVAVAIDDYGTGYTSLAYLRRLPVTQLKIDRSFVTAMRQLDENAAIVRSMIQLARQLGLEVVAEGVEDRETLVELAALGCDSAQGYYVSRPVAPDRLPEVLHGYERSQDRSAEPGPEV
jgi:diguanylate cyclase